ncbi:hydrogenase maturation protein [Peptoniphilus sp. MSJ-1]|uniref:Hydrogenase maturation protein n=1 Tax=Peptoniphilus ovalis TaxID=2841503 RepID=A0ABS6FIR3_9FIRM|nr:AIR synthase related protein [Peptoniphilus ovalis]MBU5670059.1 hydrogenase maturation protein [Peptoniphilus ovalis]
MEIGKIKSKDLEKYVFDNITSNRDEVLINGGTGIDNAVLDFGGDLIVTSTDPITGASKNIGSIAINVSVNDVACQCADPVGVLLTILLPPSTTIDELDEIIRDANETCNRLSIDIVGGHTEVTDAVTKILLSTTVIGRVKEENRPKIEEIKPGDVVAVSKYIGLEGTSIIASDVEEFRNHLNEEERKIALELHEEISVLKESKIASKYNVRHMHDITEGGIYGALWETSIAINHGIKSNYKDFPILNLTKKIEDFYNIDCCKLISSGSMLMVFDKDDFERFKEEMERENIKVTRVGEVIEDKKAIVFKGGEEIILEEPGSDELYSVI